MHLLHDGIWCLCCAGESRHIVQDPTHVGIAVEEAITRGSFQLGLWAGKGMHQPRIQTLRSVAHLCLQYGFCHFYNKKPCIKALYPSYNLFRDSVAYFHVNCSYRSITIHFSRQSMLFRYCVSHEPLPRVLDRGGFHASDGHVFMFCFDQGGVIRARCFDPECGAKLDSQLGRCIQYIPLSIQHQARIAFDGLK